MVFDVLRKRRTNLTSKDNFSFFLILFTQNFIDFPFTKNDFPQFSGKKTFKNFAQAREGGRK